MKRNAMEWRIGILKIVTGLIFNAVSYDISKHCPQQYPVFSRLACLLNEKTGVAMRRGMDCPTFAR